MDILSPFLNPVLAFVATLVFGFLLSRRGKPYNGWLFNIHKLVALVGVILAVMGISRAWNALDPSGFIILLLVFAAVGVIALFASGALMSANVGKYRVIKLIHNVSPVVTVVAMGGALYYL